MKHGEDAEICRAESSGLRGSSSCNYECDAANESPPMIIDI